MASQLIPLNIQGIPGDRGMCLYSELPLSGNLIGDKVTVSDRGYSPYTWTGTSWGLPSDFTLAQTALPMILPSSGSIAANGALTGLTALPYAAFPQSCYMYFPAGAVYAGSVAGLFYTSILTATTATVFNNVYGSGIPVIPAAPTAVVAAGPGAYTQVLTAVALHTTTLTGGMLGLNGGVVESAKVTMANTAGNKTFNCNLGGIAFGSTVYTTQVSARPHYELQARGVQSSQLGTSLTPPGGSGSFFYRNFDLTVDQLLTKSFQLAAATDYAILEGFVTTVNPR